MIDVILIVAGLVFLAAIGLGGQEAVQQSPGPLEAADLCVEVAERRDLYARVSQDLEAEARRCPAMGDLLRIGAQYSGPGRSS